MAKHKRRKTSIKNAENIVYTNSTVERNTVMKPKL